MDEALFHLKTSIQKRGLHFLLLQRQRFITPPPLLLLRYNADLLVLKEILKNISEASNIVARGTRCYDETSW